METKAHRITGWELQVIGALCFLPDFCLLPSLQNAGMQKCLWDSCTFIKLM